MSDAAVPDEAAKGTAEEVWGRDPAKVFQLLRNRACEAVAIVCELHRRALAAPPGASLANVGSELQKLLTHAVVEALAIWNCTPISTYLDRPEGPVSSDIEGRQRADAGSGSCYHDLAIGLAYSTLRAIRDGYAANDFAGAMRLRTAAGDQVNQHLASLIPKVRCECQQGMAQWAADRGHREAGQGDGSRAVARRNEEAKPKTRRGRKLTTDPKADKRVADAWATGSYTTYDDCGRALGKTGSEVKQAIDRHRHRPAGKRSKRRKSSD